MGTTKATVSVLIPAYNAERWIADTISSALAQTWRPLEVIVVDDGSTDHTLEFARRCEAENVKVVSQQNRGACAARNLAFRLCQGDYIQWLDADDLLAPGKIELQLSTAGARDPATLLTSAWGRFLSNPRHARFVPSPLWEHRHPVDWIMAKFLGNAFMLPASWLVSRHLTERAGLWDERLTLDDDGEYACRLVSKSAMVHFVSGARCYYRSASTHSQRWNRSEGAVKSQFLSVDRCIQQLLALENSDRTRKASIAFIQDNFPFFYPEREAYVRKLEDLARHLGGEVRPPQERLHFRVAAAIFGYGRAKRLRNRYRQFGTASHRLLEGFAFTQQFD
jgi:glycosyltransferase involved in cell wall biosynthesis